MTRSRILLGRQGEDLAVDFLKKSGYKVIERNFRCKSGEIDIIAIDNKIISFVEVKTRTGNSYGPPKLAVDSRKQRQLTGTALTYLKKNGLMNRAARFDVVGIIINGNCRHIELIKNAFEVVY